MDDLPPTGGPPDAAGPTPGAEAATPPGSPAGSPVDADARPRHPDDLPPVRGPMRVPRGLLWAMSLAVVVLVIASWVMLSNDNPPTTAPGARSDGVVRLVDPNATLVGGAGGDAMLGKPAPNVSWESFSGGRAGLRDLAGTPVVLNFWNSDCPPCVTEMPALQKVHSQAGAKVTFVGLDTIERSDEAARRLVERTGVQYALGHDRDGQIAAQFGALGLPTTVLIDANGTIAYLHLGAITEDELTRQIHEKFGL